MKKRVTAMLLCTLLFCAAVVPAGAIDLSKYRFQVGGVDIPGYDYDKPYMYPSSLTNRLRVDENGDGIIDPATETIGDVWHTVLHLVNLAAVEKGGEGYYASVPAYCFDFNVAVRKGRIYTLEELDKFSQSNEKNDKLRAILRHSFPRVRKMEELQADVNAWLKKTDGLGYTPVQNLTHAETIAATQTAVWSVTNLIEIVDYLEGTTQFFKADNSMFFSGYGDQPIGVHSEKNIEQVFRYLKSLPPEGPAPLKDYGFKSVSAFLTPADDDTYTATINVKLKAKADEKVEGELQAVCGSLMSNVVALTKGADQYTLTLKGIAAPKAEIDVTLNGVQIIEDAFLLEPDGGRSSAQTMGGFVNFPHEINITERAIAGELPVPPQTGDSAPLALLAVLGCLSLAGVLFLRRRRA